MFEVVDLVVGCSAFRHETASDVNVLFSPLPVCASLSAVCQLTLNDKPVVSKMEGGGGKHKALSLSQSVTQLWDLQKRTTVSCLFGNVCESV